MLKVVIGSYRVFADGYLFMVFGLGALFLSSVVFTFIKIFIKDRRKRTLYSRAFTSNSFKLYLISGTVLGIFRIRFNNLDVINNDKGVIFIANHPSLLDYVLITSAVKNASVVVKNTLTRNFFVKGIIECNDYISNSKDCIDVMDMSSKMLQSGDNLLIFPEGTRTVDKNNIKFLHGFTSLALKGNFNIRPIILKMKGRALRKNGPFYLVSYSTIAYEIEVKEIFNTKEFVESQGDIPASALSRRMAKHLQNFYKEELTKIS